MERDFCSFIEQKSLLLLPEGLQNENKIVKFVMMTIRSGIFSAFLRPKPKTIL